MRNAFAKELLALADADARVVLLSGDIGNRMFDEFKQRYPSRFYNCGVAEANMMGVAAGLAMCGLRPVVYTIVPFVTTRCLEQIRVDVCYHENPVVIVGVGGGLSYAGLGATHHSCEDIAMLRVLPGMTVVCPGDRYEVSQSLRAALELNAPVYLRLGKKGEPDVHTASPDFQIGRAITVCDGSDVAVLSCGNLLPVAQEVGQRLASAGISSRVVSMHTVKPLDWRLLDDVFRECQIVVTLEEHSVLGGLGGAVAEWLSEQPDGKARLMRVGAPDRFLHEAGDQQHARDVLGLTVEAIAPKIEKAWRELAEKAT